jgi:hypothetical protein
VGVGVKKKNKWEWQWERHPRALRLFGRNFIPSLVMRKQFLRLSA